MFGTPRRGFGTSIEGGSGLEFGSSPLDLMGSEFLPITGSDCEAVDFPKAKDQYGSPKRPSMFMTGSVATGVNSQCPDKVHWQHGPRAFQLLPNYSRGQPCPDFITALWPVRKGTVVVTVVFWGCLDTPK